MHFHQNIASVALLTLALQASSGATFTIPNVRALVSRQEEAGGAGVTLDELYRAIKEYLAPRNAYDPDVDNKCVLTLSTYQGGSCQGWLQCEQTDQIGEDIGAFGACNVGGVNQFTNDKIGNYQVVFSKAGGVDGDTTDGLHTPIITLDNVDGAVDAEAAAVREDSTGKLCAGPQSVAGTQSIQWSCGFPVVGTALFGESNQPQEGGGPFVGGWCTAHVAQFQKNENGVGADYRFDVTVFDGSGQVVAALSQTVDPNTRSTSFTSDLLTTPLIVTAGLVDSDPVNFKYADQEWNCGAGDTGGDHDCTLGQGAEDGYENGNREGDMGWTC